MTVADAGPWAMLVTPLVVALAARWGSNAGIKSALRGIRGDVARVERSATRAHERIDNILRA